MMKRFLHSCVSYQKWFDIHEKSIFVNLIKKNSNFGRNFCRNLYFLFAVSYWIREGKYWILNFEALKMVWMLTHRKLFSYWQVFAKMLEWRYKKTFSFVPFRYHALKAGTRGVHIYPYMNTLDKIYDNFTSTCHNATIWCALCSHYLTQCFKYPHHGYYVIRKISTAP